ncbi:MAG: hypothetical protein JRI68_05805 [Deltaproteobacteria bacterium]|nr:hypothetical protein [Deltaproteobacteria bacterium]
MALVLAGPSFAGEPDDSGSGAEPKDKPEAVHHGRAALILPAQVLLAPGVAVPPPFLERHRRVLDALLTDTAQDLGLEVDVSEEEVSETATADRHQLRRLAKRHAKLVIVPRLRRVEGGEDGPLELTLIVARPGSKVLHSRVERVERSDVMVRAAVMLRDLVRELSERPVVRPIREREPDLVAPANSAGRAVLAVNGTIFGGYVGLSLQRSAQSDDPRLLYPLMGVGAGVGLGAAIIVADEWDVGAGDAWYLAAGGWWPAVGGHLIYEGRFGDTPSATEDAPWSLALVASTTGLTLSTVGLLSRGMGDGGAVLAHSGGALGLLVGGLAEFAESGQADQIPHGGMGYGAMGGWLIASAVAINYHPDLTQMITIDVGILLGGLAGASAGSPLLFDEVDATKTRGWVAATGGGMLAGGALAWWLTLDDEEPPVDADHPTDVGISEVSLPVPGMVGLPPGPGELGQPGVGLQLHGVLW